MRLYYSAKTNMEEVLIHDIAFENMKDGEELKLSGIFVEGTTADGETSGRWKGVWLGDVDDIEISEIHHLNDIPDIGSLSVTNIWCTAKECLGEIELDGLSILDESGNEYEFPIEHISTRVEFED